MNEGVAARRASCSLAALLVLATLAACGQNGTTPPAGSGGSQTITGNERLGWDVQAADTAELSQIRYAIYIDNARSELTAAACTPPAGPAGFPCSAPLPRMSAGEHTIELASFMTSGSNILESAKSPPLRVIVGSGAGTGLIRIPGPPDEEGIPDRTIITADGIRLNLHVAPKYFDEPTDIAVAPDGRLFVAERAGRVRLVARIDDEPQTALTLDDVEFGASAGGLLAIALSPRYSEDSLAYLLYTTTGAEGPAFRVARFREVSGRFGERAVLLGNVAASPVRPTGSLRFGADGLMYVAFDDGGDPAAATRGGSFNGKILRLTPDGTTPADRATADPVFSEGHLAPRGFDWHPVTGALWVIDARPDGERLGVADPGLRRLRPRQFGTVLPQQTDAWGVAVYRSTTIRAMHGDLLVAAQSGNLLRLHVDPRTRLTVNWMERLLPDAIGPVRAVTMGPDGAIVAVGASLMILSPADR